MSKNPWLPILESLPLSATEQTIVDRFCENIEGKGFLPVADVLRSYDRHDEAIELMMQGVERHPDFIIAKVVLARDLMERGLVVDAWELLEPASSSLVDNTVAQRLMFRAAILLSRYSETDEIRRVLEENKMMDDATRVVANNLAVEGMSKARERLIAEYESRGVFPILPSRHDELERMSTALPIIEPVNPSLSHKQDDKTDNFSVVDLKKVFSNEVLAITPEEVKAQKNLVLDSFTLAEIYEKQGHYRKALGIYQRLLRAEPHNDIVRASVSRLKQRVSEQKEQDFSIDPAIADQIEQLEIIDCQMRFFQKLLNKIT